MIPKISRHLWIIPARKRGRISNYGKITRESIRLMLFAGDQKVEHLNDDFFRSGDDPSDEGPKHLFQIASNAKIGVFAAQLGLSSARYGSD